MIKIVAGIFINEDNEILLLKRSENRKDYPNKWNVLSEKIQSSENPETCLERGIKEGLGISNYQVIRKGEPFVDVDDSIQMKWLVYPYLCKILDGGIKLDAEHVDYKWVEIGNLSEYDCVPGMYKDLETVGVLSYDR